MAVFKIQGVPLSTLQAAWVEVLGELGIGAGAPSPTFEAYQSAFDLEVGFLQSQWDCIVLPLVNDAQVAAGIVTAINTIYDTVTDKAHALAVVVDGGIGGGPG